LSAIAFSI